MSDEHRKIRKRLAYLAAPPMFVVSLVFLANIATLIVVWVDVPRVGESQQAAAAAQGPEAVPRRPAAEHTTHLRLGYACLALAAALWPIYVLEFLVCRFFGGTGTRAAPAGIWACFCPPLRLGTPHPEMDGRIWLPKFGWSRVNHELRERLERVFGLPMIVIALMILPILLVEFGFQEQITQRPWLRILLHLSTGMIWFAFALEFIVMCSVADNKLRYCKEHWVDLAIILLPLISFLRSLRALRATRLARLAKVQQLTKMARVYRLRGLTMKGFRALLLFDVLSRVVGVKPEQRLRSLKEQLAQKELEVHALRRRIEEVERSIAAAGAEE